MGIYHYPDGILGKVKASAIISDASAEIAGSAVMGDVSTAGGLAVLTNTALGDASGDTLSMFGDAASAQQSTPDDCEVTASAVTAATQLNLLLDRLTTAGILGGT